MTTQRLFCWRGVLVVLGWCAVAPTAAAGDDYKFVEDLPYRDGEQLTDYMRERCRLDVYYPADKQAFATVVWFHGGALRHGERYVPPGLKGKGVAVVAVNYRLSPKAAAPAYLEDAAAAVAWTLGSIERYGGARDKVVVSGHSAGGYLAAMVGLDKRWLEAEGADADDLAGVAPLSGQTLTHWTIRAERGLPEWRPVVDNLAPVQHLRKDAPPVLLVTGDRRLEFAGRYEENALLAALLKDAGHGDVELFEMGGSNHGQMTAAAYPLLLRFVERVTSD